MKIVLTANTEFENMGKYNRLTVHYYSDGKESTRQVVSFGDDKPAFEVLKGSLLGEVYEVSPKKNGKYWNWVDAKKLDETQELPPSRPRKRDYEGDAERQASIIKQTCLKAAAGFHMGMAAKESEQAVLNSAETFYKWVTTPLTSTQDTTLVDEVV